MLLAIVEPVAGFRAGARYPVTSVNIQNQRCHMRLTYSKRRIEQLDYIQSILRQVRTMAETERCDMLAYLIDVAYLEARDILRSERPLRVGEDKRDGAA
jgi:hypothetical protein